MTDPNNLEGTRTPEQLAENFRELQRIAPTHAHKLQLMIWAMNQSENPPPQSSARPFEGLSDEELFDEIRSQVNASRVTGKHDRARTRQLSAEANHRGWNLRAPKP
jgi:hypothetical protein